MSNKRMKRDSMRVATDGIASTNPIPLAIPILKEMTLPPDRPSGSETTSSSPSLSDVSRSSVTNASEALDSRNDLLAENDRWSVKYDDNSKETTAIPKGTMTIEFLRNSEIEKLSSLIKLGHNCAKLMSSTCVSEQLSKSYS